MRARNTAEAGNSPLNPAPKTATEELLHCKQFILGPHFIDVMPGWQYLDIGHDLKLTYHPELDIEQAAHADKKFTAIGHILDSLTPDKSNRDILSDLIDGANDIHSLTRAIGIYGGRWIIIASFGNKTYLFNDALGFRQVFYTHPAVTGSLWMLSQPGLAEKYLNLEVDVEAEKFMDSFGFRSRDEFSWPAAATAFSGLSHLSPNHYLDLGTGRSHRFWPYASIGTMTTGDAAAYLESRMKNIMRAAAHRYPLAIGLTAGIDSRLVMALSKDIGDNIAFITVRKRNMQDDHPDIAIPKQLCEKHGLKHRVIRAKPGSSPDFAKLFKDSVFMATDIYGPDAEAIINEIHRMRAVVTGSAGEMGQCFFLNKLSKNMYNGPITASKLARLQSFADESFAIKHFQAWLDDAHKRHDVNLMDLFYWEHSHGNWVAMTQMQFDIAWREIFTPYNCRDVLQAFLSVEQRDRIPPRLLLYKNIISRAWPELLDLPINPHKADKFGAKRKIQKFMNNNFKRIRRLFSGN